MLTPIKSATLMGLTAILVDVEVDAKKGLPREQLVGLPGPVIKESKSRIQAAIKNSHYEYPNKVYTINLAPAELQKEGPFFDLPIALGILHSTQQLTIDCEAMYVGELSLTGDVKPVRGILSICQLAKKMGLKRIFLPTDNAPIATLIDAIEIIPVKSLRACCDIIEKIKKPPPILPITPKQVPLSQNYSDVKGQLAAKRILEIAAAGNHNVLFIGSPGSGKTMLLKRLPSILPPLTIEEAIESVKVTHLHHAKPTTDIAFTRPFRNPHHSISYAGLVGGGTHPKPGEISMAHLGILFLDELPEFSRQVIEVLRQPLEDQSITLTRANFTVTYPAQFMFVAAMNPCPCGYYRDPVRDCQCQENQIMKYWKKISGPILDRIDLILHVPRLDKDDFFNEQTKQNPYTSSHMLNRVLNARKIQSDRLGHKQTNSQMQSKAINTYCQISTDGKQLLGHAVDKGQLSGRSYDKVLKVARSIADLDQSDDILKIHLTEALQYRKVLV